jgi:hypothetical protein
MVCEFLAYKLRGGGIIHSSCRCCCCFFLPVDIKSVPVWDADQGKFVGMFTATDFVNILRHFYIRGSPMNELAEYSIASWRGVYISFLCFHFSIL